jgi:transposase
MGRGSGYGRGMGPYGMELRERVWRALEQGKSSEEVGERFGIDPSCVRKWCERGER